jgi:hypothetical protein
MGARIGREWTMNEENNDKGHAERHNIGSRAGRQVKMIEEYGGENRKVPCAR